jgi:4-hydroxybenzoate polyprenyltransferase
MPPSPSDADSHSKPGSLDASGLDVRTLLRLSRPRFWMYLIGPYLVGLLAGAHSPKALLDWRAACFGVFFLFPANLFVYGVNDAYDLETDALNSKKGHYEARLHQEARLKLLGWSAGLTLPFVGLALLTTPPRALAALGLFLLLSHQYSAPPLRAKARPFLDSASNILYACPGFFGYSLLGGESLDLWTLTSAWCWCAAMHAYSAVPDIQADKEAGVPTTATFLGARVCLLLCGGLYSIAALGSAHVLGWLSALLGAVYVAMVVASLRAFSMRGTEGVMSLYRFFPLLNTAAGFLLFWRIAWIKFGPEILRWIPPL